MYYYSDGDLVGVVARMSRPGHHYPWFWYRGVMRQAEERGMLRITGHSDDNPFWWRPFGESIEVLSEKIREEIKNMEGEQE